MRLTQKRKEVFQKVVWDYYAAHSRATLPWRQTSNPYRIWVSEVMLQQTQVDRVTSFFKNWMKQFPTIKKLADASQIDVLRAWKGLGYNSRALRMKRTAEMVVKKYKGVFPKTYDEILELPGIGPYTAGAICAFAYNIAVPIIETNIRRVFIYHFFPLHASGEGGSRSETGEDFRIHDKQIIDLVTQTIDSKNAREWYWALMDYGSHLGKTIPNPNKKSRHYAVQKKFKGSDREIRGKILELLLNKKTVPLEQLFEKLKSLSSDHDRIETILDRMDTEGFVKIGNTNVSLLQK